MRAIEAVFCDSTLPDDAHTLVTATGVFFSACRSRSARLRACHALVGQSCRMKPQ